jgi:hypothetical protein
VAVSEADEKLVLLSSIAQIINNMSELNKNIKMSQVRLFCDVAYVFGQRCQ